MVSVSDMLTVLTRPETLAALATLGTSVGAILGYFGGIPQVVRWLSKRPSLQIQNVRVVASKASDIMQSSVDKEGKLTGVDYLITFNIWNRRKRWRVLRISHATGLAYVISISDKETNEQIHSFGAESHMTVLPPGLNYPVLGKVPKFLGSKEYRVDVYAYCDEGVSTYVEETVRA